MRSQYHSHVKWGRIPGAIEAGEDIINAINHPATMGNKMAYAAVE